MKVKTASSRGFCLGVEDAIELAEAAVSEHGAGKVVALGPLIHNRQVVDKLPRAGLDQTGDLESIAPPKVLVDHDGKLIEDVGYFWDHAERRYKIAHDYLIANYVCTSGKHYPLEFRRFVKRDRCEAKGVAFRDHNVLFRR